MSRPIEIYEVFAARNASDQPLRHMGNVRASEPATAGVYARTMYDEWAWRAMFVVRRSAIITVIAPK
jgi:1,2-phenylacetyl-CoA epoxidase PaaB subunit